MVHLLIVPTKKHTAQKQSFSLIISSVPVTKSPRNEDLVTYTEEILNWNISFSCAVTVRQREKEMNLVLTLFSVNRLFLKQLFT